MFDWLKNIPNLEQNIACGALGAILIALYQIYNHMPEIDAILSNDSPSHNNPSTSSSSGTRLKVMFTLLFKVIISVGCAAFVAGFLVRPQETYGAIITGMTWTTVVKNLIQVKRKP